MNFLKKSWAWILAGLVITASLLKGNKWQKIAIDNESADVSDSIDDANEAFADSDEHNTEALNAIQEGKDTIKEVEDGEESVDDLLDRLRKH